MKKTAFLFPGQGAQYPGMGKDFFEGYSVARQIFEKADDILGKKFSRLIFEGPELELTETKNSQLAIYIVSYAILQVLSDLFPPLKPFVCAGLSLGEYTALTGAGYISFEEGVSLVRCRGAFMNEACMHHKGAMAVVLGLEADQVEALVKEAALPDDLWAANFNCPNQVVLSGTSKGIEAGSFLAKERGAKRVLPLQVHGAFHSGLMRSAEEKLREPLQEISLRSSSVGLVMNVTGTLVQDSNEIKKNLLCQVTSPVRWEQGMREMERLGVDFYMEMGPGKTLAGFHKRIGIQAPMMSVETVEDLKTLEFHLKEAKTCAQR